MRSVGYAADTFSTAQDFLNCASIRRYDCLILDVQMPDISGLKLQDRLCELGIELPIIFITSFSDIAVRERALAAGARAFLSKPFDVGTMLGLIENVLHPDVEVNS